MVVEWDDVTTNTAWVEEGENEEPLRVHSVGWLVASNKESIIISPMRSDNGRCSDRQLIPRRVIVSKRVVER